MRDFQLWEKEQTELIIDFGHNEKTSSLGIPVDTDTNYKGQGYGWVTENKRQFFTFPKKSQSKKDLNGIWSKQDGVFRVDLPNGRYIVTSMFSTQEKFSKIDLFANGNRYIRNLSLSSHSLTISYPITITDQQLIQVIHSRQKEKGWVWLNCSIKLVSAE